MSVIGLDISRGSATCCVLHELPKNLLEFARNYSPLVVSADASGIRHLLSLGDVFILEPTGSYHRIFSESLIAQGKQVYFVPGRRIRAFAINNGILNKKDKEDAAVIASYGFYNLERGNLAAFIPAKTFQLRELWMNLKMLVRDRVTLINQVRGNLAYELPELAAATATNRTWCNPNPPALWRRLAEDSAPESIGRGLSLLTRQLTKQICQFERMEYELERLLRQILISDELSPYREVFNHWDIPPKTQCAILAAIYPIEQFFEDGKPKRDRVQSDSGKKSVRHRSLKSFQRALGLGRMSIQSGKTHRQVATGDPEIRSALYQFLLTKVVIRRQPTIKTLRLKFPELEAMPVGLSKKEQAKCLAPYLFPGQLDRWIKDYNAHVAPWENPQVIQRVAEYSQSTEAIAALQIYYEKSPTCLNLPAKARIAKLMPRLARGLFRDLVKRLIGVASPP